MGSWFARKVIDLEALPPDQRLKPSLDWWQLLALGVGGIVGTGIYTLVGVGANLAGPAVTLSFLVAGAVCACAALAYAEVSTTIPASGSAYTYAYVTLGEVIAWVVGWSLILEYSLVVGTVAVGWSGYASGFLAGLGVNLPHALLAGPLEGGVINLPAIVIVAVVAGVMMAGTRESATLNAALVVVKIAALLLFIAVALPHFDMSHYRPFMPYGFAAHAEGGLNRGVMAAAAIIFFAFYGFDAISTAAEEAKDPGRTLPIGIIGSMAICTTLYVLVGAAAVGALPVDSFAHSSEPLAAILRSLGQGGMAVVIGAAAVVALPTVILAFLFGQSRIFFVMARDKLLPQWLAHVSPRTGAPVRITAATAVLVAILSGLVPLSDIAALANAGTLLAFASVAVCMLVLRKRLAGTKRLFLTPWPWVVGTVTVVGCLYLFWSLPQLTRVFFLVWNVAGLLYYAAWKLRKSTP
jgi:APA family basic amino acid/polyamine antiporter